VITGASNDILLLISSRSSVTGLFEMVEESLIASLDAGFICMGLSWDDQPLHSDPALILELNLTDGLLAFLVLENRLVVEIGRTGVRHEEMTDQWITPELVRPEGSSAVVTLKWQEGKISVFRLNAKEVPRSSEVEEFVLGPQETKTLEYDLEPTPTIDVELKRFITPPPFEFKQLLQTVTRLEANLKQMRSNSTEKVLDVAVYLRTLLCGKVGNGGRLLFRCAEEVGIVPVCYTVSGLEGDADAVPFMDDKTMLLHCGVAGLRSPKMPLETNLEMWLEQPALRTLAYELKHWELIREVAGKFGAHADRDPKILLSFMNPHDAGVNLGILIPQFRSYGFMALEASKRVISQAQS
jgi:hypothetical protein